MVGERYQMKNTNVIPDWSKFLALALGGTILVMGLLKMLVSPFRDWYAAQIATSGLPTLARPFGSLAEIAVAALFLAPWVAPVKFRARRRDLWILASAGLAGIMLAAAYVHLQPGVPADVLPLKYKPPVIPLAVLLVATGNLYRLLKADSDG